MPRIFKIIAVPVGRQWKEVASGGDEEVNAEAPGMTGIIIEVDVEPDEQTVEQPPFVEVAKPQAKARAQKAPKQAREPR